MRANGIEHTVSSGGTGALTLAAVSGKPAFDDVYGTSGSRFVEYTINDGNNLEWGFGSIALSTLVLTRTLPQGVWNGTTYDDDDSLTVLTVSTSATVICAPLASSFMPPPPRSFVGLYGGADNNQYFPPANMLDAAYAGFTLTANRVYWVPFEWLHNRPIDAAAVEVTAAAAAKVVRVGLFEIDPTPANLGKPGRLIADFGAFSTTSTGVIVITAASWTSPTAAFRLQPGHYWLGIVSDGTPGIMGSAQVRPTFQPMVTGRQLRYWYRSMTYGAFADPGSSNGSGSAVAVTNTSTPFCYLRMSG